MAIAYEQLLKADPQRALLEGGMHFEKESAVHRSLQRITRRLDELGIPYALSGGMSMFLHGYRRFTEYVDILVTADGLAAVHQHLDGRGYVPPFSGSRNLRDAETGVRIEFLVTGQYPGDGRPKPVVFPSPDASSVEIEGIHCLRLDRLVELKLAPGTAPGRRRDLADVQELIRVLDLPCEFEQQLDPSVRALYEELWAELQDAPAEPW